MDSGWVIGGIAAAALVLDLIAHLVGGTWLLAKSREGLAREFADQLRDMRREIDDELKEQKQQIAADLANQRSEFSETFKAVRQGLVDVSKEIGRVELDSYKIFTRRDSVYEVINRESKLMTDRFEKMEKQIDELNKVVRSIPSQVHKLSSNGN